MWPAYSSAIQNIPFFGCIIFAKTIINIIYFALHTRQFLIMASIKNFKNPNMFTHAGYELF